MYSASFRIGGEVLTQLAEGSEVRAARQTTEEGATSRVDNG